MAFLASALGSALAHAGEVETGETGRIALEIIVISVLVIVWAALGVVCWIFYRAKKRDDAAAKTGPEWGNARSS